MKTGSAARDLDHLTHLAADSARFVEALAQTPPEGLGVDLPRLGRRRPPVAPRAGSVVLGRDHRSRADLSRGGREPRQRWTPRWPRWPARLLRAGQRRSAHNLAAASPQTSAWTWSRDQRVGSIRRRQAHEALIDRVDAELTAGDRTPMDPDLRTDGVHEALCFLDAEPAPSAHLAPAPPLQCGSRPPIPPVLAVVARPAHRAEGNRHGP